MEAAGKRYIVHGSRADKFSIWHMSDLHLMSKACSEDDIAADVERIREDPYAFWLGGGDYADFIGYSDKRFDPDAVAEWVKVSDLKKLGKIGMTKVRDVLLPIKDKCLGLLIGNHEKQYELRKDHEGLHGWLCTELDAPDLQYSALFDLVFVRKARTAKPYLVGTSPSVVEGKGRSVTFRVFSHHGAGYSTTPGGKLNRLVQFMQAFVADIYFAGHVHDQVGRREPTIGANADCTKLESYDRVGVISGSYLKTYAQGVTTYGEQKGYRPTTLGAATVTIIPDKRKVRGEI